MATVNIFQTLRKRILASSGVPIRERKAMLWFQDYSTQLTRWQRQQQQTTYDDLRRDTFSKQLVSQYGSFPGFFYFFLYDPKLKDELPYYDRFPFVLVLSTERDSFLGLNFHYLDYFHRAMLFDALYPFRNSTRNDIRTRMLVSYELLKLSSKYKAFKPCIKRYLADHVQTPLMKVGANDWDTALFLPVESFVKQPKTTVWRDSRDMI